MIRLIKLTNGINEGITIGEDGEILNGLPTPWILHKVEFDPDGLSPSSSSGSFKIAFYARGLNEEFTRVGIPEGIELRTDEDFKRNENGEGFIFESLESGEEKEFELRLNTSMIDVPEVEFKATILPAVSVSGFRTGNGLILHDSLMVLENLSVIATSIAIDKVAIVLQGKIFSDVSTSIVLDSLDLNGVDVSGQNLEYAFSCFMTESGLEISKSESFAPGNWSSLVPSSDSAGYFLCYGFYEGLTDSLRLQKVSRTTYGDLSLANNSISGFSAETPSGSVTRASEFLVDVSTDGTKTIRVSPSSVSGIEESEDSSLVPLWELDVLSGSIIGSRDLRQLSGAKSIFVNFSPQFTRFSITSPGVVDIFRPISFFSYSGSDNSNTEFSVTLKIEKCEIGSDLPFMEVEIRFNPDSGTFEIDEVIIDRPNLEPSLYKTFVFSEDVPSSPFFQLGLRCA